MPITSMTLCFVDENAQPALWLYAETLRRNGKGPDADFIQQRLRDNGYEEDPDPPWECDRLSVRSRNVLRRWATDPPRLSDKPQGPRTWAGLSRVTPRDLLMLKNLGRKGLQEIREELARRGLSLRDDLQGDHGPKPTLTGLERRLVALEQQVAALRGEP